MKFIQTLWTGGKSLLHNNFDWVSPEANIMSWSLSANNLKEHCKELVLYTDTEGAHILVDKLQLPYTEVVVCYDKLQCHPVHWAIAKILTYSKQSQPFIHVDGDLYLPKGLPDNLKKSGLIAQNEEIGSKYYKNMMNGILAHQPILPEYLKSELQKESIGSYNAGVLGGNDIDFIQQYCDEALKIIIDNDWEKVDCIQADMNHNLLYEQILFFALARKLGKTVDCIIKSIVGDNMYSYQFICDLMHYDESTVIHLLGGHKRNKYACEMVRKTLLRKYPKTYESVMNLFKEKFNRWNMGSTRIPQVNNVNYLTEYEYFLNKLIKKWDRLKNEELLEVEKEGDSFMFFFNSQQNRKMHFMIKLNPSLEIFSFPKTWPEEAKMLLKTKLNNISAYRFSDIAIIPSLADKGYKEILINDLQFNILRLLRSKMTYNNLLLHLKLCFSDKLMYKKSFQQIVEKELEKLSFHGLIIFSAN